ncbi:MAG: hypothetical protein N4A71_21235 [Carboxylicivirga sp.]|jgi:hypothetical protein|nr:hypothetical protein [Carboxylicivirga sp.]
MKNSLILLIIIILSACNSEKTDRSAQNDLKKELHDLEQLVNNGSISHKLGEKLKAYLSQGGQLDSSDWLYFIMSDSIRFENQSIADIVHIRNEQLVVKTSEIYATLKRAGFFKAIKPKLSEQRTIQQKEFVELTVDYALQDYSKIFLKDLEADVGQGNDAYIEFLVQLAKISDGNFNPEKITEKWESEEGPVHFSYTHKGKVYTSTEKYMNDWIDGTFLHSLNQALDHPHAAFYTFRADILDYGIVFLYDDEATILKNELNWQLEKI